MQAQQVQLTAVAQTLAAPPIPVQTEPPAQPEQVEPPQRPPQNQRQLQLPKAQLKRLLRRLIHFWRI